MNSEPKAAVPGGPAADGDTRFRLLAESVHAGLTIVENRRVVFVNPWLCDLLGYSRDELMTMNHFDLVVPEERQVVEKMMSGYRRSRQLPSELNFWVQCRDGGKKFLVNYITYQDTRAPRFDFFVVTVDQTERRQIEESLQREHERLAVTIRSIGDGVISTDSAGRVLTFNRVAERMTGWREEQARGRLLGEVLQLSDESGRDSGADLLVRIMPGGGMEGVDETVALTSRGGGESLVNCNTAPVRDHDGRSHGTVLVLRDVAGKRRQEEDRNRDQKLESLGILAGGIAHDFNNILTAILGNITLVKLRLKDDDKSRERLVESEKAALRARELTQQLLTFSRGGAPVKKTIALGPLLREAVTDSLRGSNVRYQFRLADDLRAVEVDPEQIGRVIRNLVINADQAMLSGGSLEIVAGNIDLDGSTGLPAGAYVCVAVTDHGIGIPAEILNRVFDPYFSTKPLGSGLGLTVVYSIIRKHDGMIEAHSVPGQGSTFIFYLPAVLPAAPAADGDEDTSETRRTGKRARILLMDDEDIIIDVAGEMLNMLGYRVAIARDGMEALALYSEALQAGQPYAAVIMDLTIPGGLGGREAVTRLLEIDPNVRAIVSSGYFNDPVMANYRDHGFRGIINKPYHIEELERVLAEVLGGG